MKEKKANRTPGVSGERRDDLADSASDRKTCPFGNGKWREGETPWWKNSLIAIIIVAVVRPSNPNHVSEYLGPNI